MHKAPKKSLGFFFLIGKIDKRWYEIKFSCKEILLKFTINYSLFKLNYNLQQCSAISLTVVMLCVCTKRVCARFTELVCKAVRLVFSCQTSAISFPFIPVPCIEGQRFGVAQRVGYEYREGQGRGIRQKVKVGNRIEG